MPVHDWSRVVAGIFHDFHQRWIGAIRDHLNEGLLPSDFYALAEQDAAGPIPDVLTLERTRLGDDGGPSAGGESHGAWALAEHPPKVSFTVEVEQDLYARKASRIAVYHSTGDRVVAYVEILSAGNKHSQQAMSAFLAKVEQTIKRGLHLLLIDLHRPTPRDPRGIHTRIWQEWYPELETPGATRELPFTLVSYRSDLMTTAYYEPVGLGQTLPEMPLFLTPEHYVSVPLEATYLEAWRGVPQRWKEVIDAK